MPTRREVLKGGLGVFALGVGGSALGAHGAIRSIVGPLAQRSGTASPLGAAMLEQLKASRPLGARSFDPKARMIDGFAFKSWFEGDDFEEDIPFHSMPHDFPNGEPPEPTEEIDVVVIGGGLSGLASAYELREYNPVVFELHDVFGGNAQGGRIHGAPFSLGSAYFITPDPGGELDRFYAELGLHEVIRADELASPVEIEGEINPDIWSGMGVPKEDIPAYEAYRKLVIRMTDEYPDVPFDQDWMLELDQLSLREHIEQEMGMPVPAALAAAIQAYCYSSFTAGWEEISAMLGWNFLAAEEFGRWVLPGGNAWIADKLWEKLYPLDRTDPDHAPHLRPNRHVVDTRQVQDGRWQVTWKEPDGAYLSLLAREVVMACPKNIARLMIPGLEQEDEARYSAMRLTRRAYLVANVIVNRPIPLDFYDIFLLEHPEDFPMSEGEAGGMWRYTDVLNGSFTQEPGGAPLPIEPSVLTLYWPLAYEDARFTLFLGDPIETYAKALAAKLRETLHLVGMDESDVMEIRLARWGHAMPVARVGFVADGSAGLVRSAYRESMHFVNQDNWALPAVENAFLDAFEVAKTVRGRLG